MATIYTVSVSLSRNHDGTEYTVDWLKLQLVDGISEWDRWSLLANSIAPGTWPEVGDWSRSPAVGQVDLFTNNFTTRLASLATPNWPWSKSSEGEVLFYTPMNGTTKGRYRVLDVE